jgi:undecaprenyl-diphosphatase
MQSYRRSLLAVGAISLTLLWAAPGWAKTQSHFRPLLDISLSLGAGVAWLLLDQATPKLGRATCPCVASQLNAVDRAAVSWSWHPGGTAADVTLAAGLSLSVAMLWLAPTDPVDRWNALGLATESVLIAGLLTQTVKIAVSRPFPYMYGTPYPGQVTNPINYTSFWSGHTAVPMSAVVTALMLLNQMDAPLPYRLALAIGGTTLALAAGALQASAGNHFPTDVAAGAAAGAAVGFINPWLHSF